MINIDSTLKNMELTSCKKYGILLASIMFLWSGMKKILMFGTKVDVLSRKTSLSKIICQIGMILVILLELLGFMFIIEYYFKESLLYDAFSKINNIVKLTQKQLIQVTLLLLLLFLVVVTLIYHPLDLKKPIPFLSNVTTFGLFLFVYCDLFKK